jgi:hypothetical protein
VLLGLGLLGYAALRAVQAVFDPERRGRSLFMVLVRIGEAFNAVGHALLAWGAFNLQRGRPAPLTGDAQTRQLARQTLALPFGDGLVGLAGGIILAVGLSLTVRGIIGKNVCGDLVLDRVPRPWCRAIAATIRFGRIAQGVLFTVIGCLFIIAAWDRAPHEARGPAGALQLLGRYENGQLWVALIAAGMIAVALSCLFDALWRRYPRISDS